MLTDIDDLLNCKDVHYNLIACFSETHQDAKIPSLVQRKCQVLSRAHRALDPSINPPFSSSFHLLPAKTPITPPINATNLLLAKNHMLPTRFYIRSTAQKEVLLSIQVRNAWRTSRSAIGAMT
jgi:hypothetical protein